MTDATETERVIADARAICAVPAPTFVEGPRAQLVAQMLGDAGAQPTLDGVGNVVAGIGEGERELVLAAHLDTVFAAGTEIDLVQRDGRLAAPGIGDNSLGVAALVHLARHLREHPPARRVVLAATVCEEGLGDLRGAKALIAGRPCDAFVAVEGMMLDGIAVAGVGSVRLRITLRGPGGHPWGDRGSPSAVHALLAPLGTIVARLERAGMAVNVGELHGGTAINVIAAQAMAELDVRSEDEAALAGVGEAVRDELAGLDSALTLEVTSLGHRPGGRIDPEHPLLDAAREARRLAALPPARESASSTDANAAHGQAVPAITVGVSTGANAHRPDEYIDLAPIPAGLRSLRALIDLLAGHDLTF
ncbi:MAG: M20/M25/M40 family metallo-hydrolase [Solirubrobacteraceae bacterium]